MKKLCTTLIVVVTSFCLYTTSVNAQSWTTIWSENFNNKTYESCYGTNGDSYWANCVSPSGGPRNSLINGSWEVTNTNLGATQSPSNASGGRFLMYWTDNAYNSGTNITAANNIVFQKTLTGLTVGRVYRVSYKQGGLLQLPATTLGNPSAVGLSINGTPVILATTVTTSWVSKTYSWTANSTSMVLQWTDSVKQVNGNDLGLDDLLVEGRNTLPIKLSFFAAQRQGSTSLLRWQTSQEINSKRIDIERSADGIHFSVIGSVAAQGQSYITKSYSFTDTKPLPRANYYRLNMIDIDGASEWSDTRVISFDDNAGIRIFPNPAYRYTHIYLPDNWTGKRVTINVFSTAGQLVFTSRINAAAQVERLALDNMTKGMYIVSIRQDDSTTFNTRLTIL